MKHITLGDIAANIRQQVYDPAFDPHQSAYTRVVPFRLVTTVRAQQLHSDSRDEAFIRMRSLHLFGKCVACWESVLPSTRKRSVGEVSIGTVLGENLDRHAWDRVEEEKTTADNPKPWTPEQAFWAGVALGSVFTAAGFLMALLKG
jgi:hypothetical protein